MPMAPYFWCSSVFQADSAGSSASIVIVIWTKINAYIITSHTANVLWGFRRRQTEADGVTVTFGSEGPNERCSGWLMCVPERNHTGLTR